MIKYLSRIKYIDFKCSPWLACFRHGRCYTHSYVEFPTSWEDIYDWLEKKNIVGLASIKRSELTQTHFTLGKYIRNELLWEYTPTKMWLESLGLNHPDDMSSVIIKKYWCYKNNKNFLLEDCIQHYQLYWKNVDNGIVNYNDFIEG